MDRREVESSEHRDDPVADAKLQSSFSESRSKMGVDADFPGDLDCSRHSNRFKSSLQTLEETKGVDSFRMAVPGIVSPDSSSDDTEPLVKSPFKRKPSISGLKNLSKIVGKLVRDAVTAAETGEEKEALRLYQNVIQLSGSEIARINVKIRKARVQPEATRRSIEDRLREDLRKVGITVGKYRTKMAILYDRMGDYDKALSCCREAMEIYKYQPTVSTDPENGGDSTEELVELMEMMTDKLSATKQALKGREAILQEVNSLRSEISQTENNERKIELYGRATQNAGILLKMELEVLGNEHCQVAETLQLLSTLALEQSKHDEAIELLRKATQIGRKSLGPRHPRNGQYHLRLARIYLSRQDDTVALDNFRIAVEILQHSSKFSKVLGSTLNDVAVLYMRRLAFDDAVESLHGALHFYEKAPPSRDPVGEQDHELSAAIDPVQVYQNLGECYMNMEEYEKAFECFQKVLKLQRDARKILDKIRKAHLLENEKVYLRLVDDDSIARTLMELGRVSAAETNHSKAIAYLKEAMEVLNYHLITSMLDVDTQNSKKTNERRRIMTNILYCIGEEACSLQNYEEAIRAYSESMRLLVEIDPSSKASQQTVLHCCLCFVGIAKVHIQKVDLFTAYNMLKKTLRYCETNGVPSDHTMVTMILKRIDDVRAMEQNARRLATNSTSKRR